MHSSEKACIPPTSDKKRELDHRTTATPTMPQTFVFDTPQINIKRDVIEFPFPSDFFKQPLKSTTSFLFIFIFVPTARCSLPFVAYRVNHLNENASSISLLLIVLCVAQFEEANAMVALFFFQEYFF